MSFHSFGLAENIARAVVERGYTEPTPIQTQAIPAVMSGRDLLAGAQTGTGKTAGFVLPILHRLSTTPAPGAQGARKPIRALILTPTRELAAQVEQSVRDYGCHTRLRSLALFGGVSIRPQIQRLSTGVDILVATPGRLLDHVQQRTIDLSRVEILVLDEADRMLDMGFIRDIKRILALLPAGRQNLLFSATVSDEIKNLADRMLNQPALIEVARRNQTADTVAQKVHPVDRHRKGELLSHLIKQYRWSQVLVFTRTKHGANKLVEQLERNQINSLAIHGNKSQAARTRALSEFKAGRLCALVATDIAARGLDISALPQVVNYELPNTPTDYVHRIGRTGRAGAVGEAVSLVCVDEHGLLKDIERLIKSPLTREIVPGFEPDTSARPQPIENGRGRGRPNGGGTHARGSSGQRSHGQRSGSGASGSASRGHGAQPARSGHTAGRPGGRSGRPAQPVRRAP
jgi:ATP-dependent RNA helicase RhlE